MTGTILMIFDWFTVLFDATGFPDPRPHAARGQIAHQRFYIVSNGLIALACLADHRGLPVHRSGVKAGMTSHMAG